MKKIIILIFIVLQSITLFSENKKLVVHYVGTTIQRIDFKDMNNKLNENGLPEFSNYVQGVSILRKSFDKKNISISNFTSSYANSKTALKNGKLTHITFKNSVNLSSGFGRIIYETPNFKFYPAFLIGFSQISMVVSEEDELSFDDILENPKRQINMSKSEFNLDFSLQCDYLIKMSLFEKLPFIKNFNIKGLALGVQAGYIVALNINIDGIIESNWESENIEINNTPDFDKSGPYLGLRWGIWKSK